MQNKSETIAVAPLVGVTLASLATTSIVEDTMAEKEATLPGDLPHPDAEKITDRDMDIITVLN